MSVSDSQKVDLLYKKLFGVAKTDLNANKGASNESIASPALNRGDRIWLQASSIPATAAALTGVVQAYQTTSRVQCTADATTTPIGGVYPTWKTGLTDWIPPEFGSTYFVKVYATTSGLSDPTSGGTQLSDAGTSSTGEWFFDYQAGVLNFIGGTIPAALTGSLVVQITGYRYIGNIGINNFSSYANSNVAAYLPTNSSDITAGNIAANGNITANSNITANGNVNASFITANGYYLTGLPASYSNTNVANYLPTYSGNIGVGNINAVGANTGVNINPTGNGVVIINSNTALQVPTGSSTTYFTASAGMVRWNNSTNYLEVYTGSKWEAVGLEGNITVITSDVFTPDGNTSTFTMSQNNTTAGTMVHINGVMQLPSIAYTVSGNVLTLNETPLATDIIEARSFGPASGINNLYGNSNVAVYLPTYSGNITAGNVTTTGNVNASYVTGNGYYLTSTITNYSNANVTAYLPTNTANITAGNITTVNGQHIGYHTGAIGANVANTGAFTTVTTTGNITISGNAAITGNTNITGNLTASGSGYFYGAYNESSTLSGVFIGNTGSGTSSPRVGFYNGTTSQNWQIDNYGGTFRWFTPGVTRMQLDTNGNLSVLSGTANVTYTPATTTGTALNIFVANTQGGAGYGDFLKVINSSGGATNPYKYFRVNNMGGLEIINSGYTSTLFSMTDVGDTAIVGNLSVSGIQPGYAVNRPAFRVVGINSTGYTTSSPTSGILTSSQFTVDYNTGSYLNASTGVFTAPVAGLYQVCFTARANSNSGPSAGIAVQRTTGGSTTNIAYLEWAANTTVNHIGASTIVKMAVGDVLKLVVTGGTVNFDGNNNWSVAYIG
jgi:hypothetical protein